MERTFAGSGIEVGVCVTGKRSVKRTRDGTKEQTWFLKPSEGSSFADVVKTLKEKVEIEDTKVTNLAKTNGGH